MRFRLVLTIVFLLCPWGARADYPAKAYCTMIYSLQGNAQSYFIEEVEQLKIDLLRHDIALVDLNNWLKQPPFLSISGRERRALRQQYQIPSETNQLVVIDNKGQEIARFTGSVTLVTAILACPA